MEKRRGRKKKPENIEVNDVQIETGKDNTKEQFSDPPLSQDQISENIRLYLNENNANNPRLKMGLSKIEYGRLTRAHTKIDKWIKDNVVDFCTDVLSTGQDWNSNEGKQILSGYVIKYKNFVRREIINNYPGAHRSEVRLRLLALFEDKVKKILETSSVK